nr:hypothetical protein [Propionicimonas sp.]
MPTDAREREDLTARDLGVAAQLLDTLERAHPTELEGPLTSVDIARSLDILRSALTLTAGIAAALPAGLPVGAAAALLAEYRHLAGERSQLARDALLRELTAALPDSVSPASLRQATREAAHRQHLLQTPTYTYEDLRLLRGDTSVQATRTAVSRMVAKRALFTVPVANRRVVVPAFLLNDEGRPRPELAPVLAPLMDAGAGPWQIWTWLTSPTGLLSGGVPAALAVDAEEAPRAAAAARRFAASLPPRAEAATA